MIQTLNDIIHNYTVRATSVNFNKKIGIWIPQKTTRNDSGLNDIKGLPYIIIQSGLPRLNIIRPSKKRYFPKKRQNPASEIDSCDIEGLPYIIIQSGLPRLNINNKKLELCIEESKSSGCCCKKKGVFV